MKLLFTDLLDTENGVGKLEFGCNPLEHVGQTAGLLPFRVRHAQQQADGAFLVYGVAGPVDCAKRFFRARTVDGIHFEQCEQVFQTEDGGWLTEFDVAYDPVNDRLITYLWKRGELGHALWAFGSSDGGASWSPLGDGPIYHDHDAFGMMWDPAQSRMVCYNTTYQTWAKLFPDNMGSDCRRVLHIRTSPDGLRWEPAGDISRKKDQQAPRSELIVPDDDDPPEIEFYRFTAFPYGDRYAGMMLIYAPSPPAVNPRHPWSKHGQHCYSEWWTSRDGISWDRSFRHVFASGSAPTIVPHAPMVVDGRMLWIVDGGVHALDEDRIFYVGARANGAFSTVVFTMSDLPLLLDAAMQFLPHATSGMFDQSYIMAELVDAEHGVIVGYEREKCVLTSMPANRIRLQWAGRDGTELANQAVRLRFYLRDARIYSVQTVESRSNERNEIYARDV